ncbi:hypothetical protein BDR03DRAFT_862762, partial [Suillus americanus]
VPCDNPTCSRLPRSMTHDHDHCLQLGRGMEGKALWNQQQAPSTPSAPSETTALIVAAPMHHQDWSCAMIKNLDLPPSCSPSAEDIACIVTQTLSTILDSGTTSTLITNREYFWTYNANAKVSMKTANHGTLLTSGQGDCVTDLTVGNCTQCL